MPNIKITLESENGDIYRVDEAQSFENAAEMLGKMERWYKNEEEKSVSEELED